VGAFAVEGCQAGRGVPLTLVRLDDHAFTARVQFMKIDVEGMEAAVLAGARALIKRDRPIVFFELLELERLHPIRALFQELGYELRWLLTDAYNPQNFCRNIENIWSQGETGILAIPDQNDSRVIHLPVVTGLETEVPKNRYA
jgi:hypothetical protein